MTRTHARELKAEKLKGANKESRIEGKPTNHAARGSRQHPKFTLVEFMANQENIYILNNCRDADRESIYFSRIKKLAVLLSQCDQRRILRTSTVTP